MATKNPGGRRLIKLNVTEVSLVDKAANGETVLLEKSAVAELAGMAKVNVAPKPPAPTTKPVSYDSATFRNLLS